MPDPTKTDDQIDFFGALIKGVRWLFRSTWNNARNWFLIFILTLIGVALLGTFFPLVPVIIAAKVFAIGFALPVSLVVGAIAISRHYDRIRKARTEFSIFTYIKEVLPDWLGKSPRNVIQFFAGCVLFALIGFLIAAHIFPLQEMLLNILPGSQLVFNLIAIPINFFQTGFSATMIVSPLGISIFLGLALLAGYDLLCRVIKAIFPVEGENEVKAPGDIDVDNPQKLLGVGVGTSTVTVVPGLGVQPPVWTSGTNPGVTTTRGDAKTSDVVDGAGVGLGMTAF